MADVIPRSVLMVRSSRWCMFMMGLPVFVDRITHDMIGSATIVVKAAMAPE
jgi:hypothetical protein